MKVSPEIEKIINKLNESKGNITNNFGTINNVQIINQELNKIINNINTEFDFKTYKKEKINSIERVINIYIIYYHFIIQYFIQLKSVLSKGEIYLSDLLKKDFNNKDLANIFNFWNAKIRKNNTKFSNFENIKILINDIDKIIENLELKRNDKENKALKEKYEYEQNMKLNNLKESVLNPLRSSVPINAIKRSHLVKNNNCEKSDNNSPNKLENKQTETPIETKNNIKDEEKKEKSDKFLKKMYSSKIFVKKDFNMDKNEEKDNNNENILLRFSSKKASSTEKNLSKNNNLDLKTFKYQEEQPDTNIIKKTKQSKSFLNFIDIDLFLQYIALGKKLYDNDEDNLNVIEGFCLQYQSFIFPDTLINKIISCFNHFYAKYINKQIEIVEEKSEDEEDNNNPLKEDSNKNENENENKDEINIVQKRRNAIKKRKRSKSFNLKESSNKIPFGLIDFLYIFINMHNTYFLHIDLSHEVISKIFDFLKKLNAIKEVKEKYDQQIELSEIELKEYESSIKTFAPIMQNNLQEVKDELLSSSEEFLSEDEKEKNEEINQNQNKEENNEIKINKTQKEDNKKDKKKKDGNSKDKKKKEKNDIKNNENNIFKLSNTAVINPNNFIDIYTEHSTKTMKVFTIKKDKKNNSKEKKDNKNSKIKEEKEKEEEKPYEFNILKYNSAYIASELARVNYSFFSKIKIKEFLKGAFNRKDKNKISPYICQIIERFNRISNWVIEEILAYDHAVQRSIIVRKFIHICKALKKIGDFDDCLSILTGLTNYNINKLYKTWEHVPPDDMASFRTLKKMLSFEGNWKNLRKEIDKRIEEKLFFIPYLGFYTKRMLYLEELGSYIKKNTSLINTEKIIEAYKVLRYFYKINNVKECKFECDENIKKELKILQCLDPSNEDILINTSNLLEPKFVLKNKKSDNKRRTKTDINFLNNMNKFNII